MTAPTSSSTPPPPPRNESSSCQPQRRRLRPPMLNLPRSTSVKLRSAPPAIRSLEEESKHGPLWAVHARRGRRRSTREDMYAAHPFSSGTSISLFAVFDGHGGSRAAKFASTQLPMHAFHAISAGKPVTNALESAFLSTDRDFLLLSSLPPLRLSMPSPTSKIASADPQQNSTNSNRNLMTSLASRPSIDASLPSILRKSSQKPQQSQGEPMRRTPSGGAFASVAFQPQGHDVHGLPPPNLPTTIQDNTSSSPDTSLSSSSIPHLPRPSGDSDTVALSRAFSADAYRSNAASSQSSLLSPSTSSSSMSFSGVELRRCKTRVNEHLSSVPVRTEQGSGTTATVVTLSPSTLVVAHVGDTRAVLCRGDGMIVTRLCEDHRPGRKDEMERIEEAGGIVVESRGTSRVNGVLAVSRSIGDLELKELVIARPDVMSLALCGDEDFVLIASDGLWDVVGDREGVDVMRRTYAKDGGGKEEGKADSWGEEGVKAVVEFAWERGSTDDICVMVIDLKKYRESHEEQMADLQPVTPMTNCSMMTQRRRGSKPW